jgi:hypothetical protein
MLKLQAVRKIGQAAGEVMKYIFERTAAAFVFIFALASSASAQRILDWPVRTNAGPEAVVRGPEAAFWNSAAITTSGGRGDVMLTDQRSPAALGVGGFAAAAAWRLDVRTTVAAGYQHVSIDDIGETSTSPLPDTGEPTFSITEDRVALGVSHALGAAVTAGAGVQYNRSNETGLNESATSLGGGFLVSPSLPLRPVIGISAASQTGGVRYAGGVELAGGTREIEIRAGYGVRGGGNLISVEHRIGITLDWRRLVAVTGGVATASAGSERSYDPVIGASLRVNRYELVVLREALANDFGAAYSFRFRLGLK